MFDGVWSPNIYRLSGQTGNVWRPNTIKHRLVTKHFTVWTPWLVLFDRVCIFFPSIFSLFLFSLNLHLLTILMTLPNITNKNNIVTKQYTIQL